MSTKIKKNYNNSGICPGMCHTLASKNFKKCVGIPRKKHFATCCSRNCT